MLGVTAMRKHPRWTRRQEVWDQLGNGVVWLYTETAFVSVRSLAEANGLISY